MPHTEQLSDFEWSFQVEDKVGRAVFWPLLLTPLWLLIAAWIWNNETVEKVVAVGIGVFAIASFLWCLAVLRLKGRYSIKIADGIVSVVSPHPSLGKTFQVHYRDLTSLILKRVSSDMSDFVTIQLQGKDGSLYDLNGDPDVPLAEIFEQIHQRNPQFECHFFVAERESDQHFKINYPDLYETVSLSLMTRWR